MTAVPPLYIMRHGETEWNVLGRLQGRFDSPLTERGVAQSRAQRDILRQRVGSGEVAGMARRGDDDDRGIAVGRVG